MMWTRKFPTKPDTVEHGQGPSLLDRIGHWTLQKKWTLNLVTVIRPGKMFYPGNWVPRHFLFAKLCLSNLDTSKVPKETPSSSLLGISVTCIHALLCLSGPSPIIALPFLDNFLKKCSLWDLTDVTPACEDCRNLYLESLAASLFENNWLSWQIVRQLRKPPQEQVQNLWGASAH